MKFKIKEKPNKIFENEFLIFPREFNGFKYWMCWATVEYNWLGWRYSRFGKMVSVGKNAKELSKTIR